jgi:hypothetical protein
LSHSHVACRRGSTSMWPFPNAPPETWSLDCWVCCNNVPVRT